MGCIDILWDGQRLWDFEHNTSLTWRQHCNGAIRRGGGRDD